MTPVKGARPSKIVLRPGFELEVTITDLLATSTSIHFVCVCVWVLCYGPEVPFSMLQFLYKFHSLDFTRSRCWRLGSRGMSGWEMSSQALKRISLMYWSTGGLSILKRYVLMKLVTDTCALVWHRHTLACCRRAGKGWWDSNCWHCLLNDHLAYGMAARFYCVWWAMVISVLPSRVKDQFASLGVFQNNVLRLQLFF